MITAKRGDGTSTRAEFSFKGLAALKLLQHVGDLTGRKQFSIAFMPKLISQLFQLVKHFFSDGNNRIFHNGPSCLTII